MRFTAAEVWLNPLSLTCCCVLALSLQIQGYCLLCDMMLHRGGSQFAQAGGVFWKTIGFRVVSYEKATREHISELKAWAMTLFTSDVRHF